MDDLYVSTEHLLIALAGKHASSTREILADAGAAQSELREALATVRGLRERGVSVWATMDAGPHVKALCGIGDASRVRQALDRTRGVTRTWVAKPGPDVEVHR